MTDIVHLPKVTGLATEHGHSRSLPFLFYRLGLISNRPGEWHTVGAGQSSSEKVSKGLVLLWGVGRWPRWRCLELCLCFPAPAFESVLQQMFKEERREEERRVTHAPPCRSL